MNDRFLMSLGAIALAILVAVVLVTPTSAAAQAQKAAAATVTKAATPAKPWTGRTPDGQPDLQGYWTNNSYTPLERPKDLTKEFYTPEELREAEKKAAEREEEQTVPGT